MNPVFRSRQEFTARVAADYTIPGLAGRLLLDCGNTRLKWCWQIVDGDGAVCQQMHGVRSHGNAEWLAGWAEELRACQQRTREVRGETAVMASLGCLVASADCQAQIEAVLAELGLAVEWLRASPCAGGVVNGYQQVERLGPDRWAALIGAHAAYPAQDCLVVTAGTATTVDVLSAEGVFQGGLILPGWRLMLESLQRGTARLPLSDGQFAAFPQGTLDAIATGCIDAQCGAIERMYQRLGQAAQAKQSPVCVLNGGNADVLGPHLTMAWELADNLVLKGLAALLIPDDKDAE